MIEYRQESNRTPLPRPSRRAQLTRSLVSSPSNIVITIICLALLAWVVWLALDWAVIRATFVDSGTGAASCKGTGGACWLVISDRWRLILFGLYPQAEQWRSALSSVLVVVLIGLSCMPYFWSPRALALLWVPGLFLFYVLMHGGLFGLPAVSRSSWGGLTLTLYIYLGVTVVGMPLALMLALLRRSRLWMVSTVTGLLIDTIRSLPLLSILLVFVFAAPRILPQGLAGNRLDFAILGAALYLSVYQAENLRSGFQSLPKGQMEAAQTLGLNYWHRLSRVVLPQAVRVVMPALINRLVIIFKETSLFLVIGFFELMASGQLAYASGEWRAYYGEVYAFVGGLYFLLTFCLSRYGAFLERRLTNEDLSTTRERRDGN